MSIILSSDFMVLCLILIGYLIFCAVVFIADIYAWAKNAFIRLIGRGEQIEQ